MANRLLKLARYEYLPAVQEVIARPAYCVTTTTRKAVTTYTTPTTVRRSLNTIDINTGIGAGGIATLNENGTYTVTSPAVPITSYQDVRETVCYPETIGVEGRDAIVVSDSQVGWNAGAASIGQYTGDLFAAFEFNPDGAGMLCGLTPAGSTIAEYNAIRYGLRLSGDTVVVVENGAILVDSGVTYTPSVSVGIHRVGGVVTYRVGAWRYTSSRTSVGTLALSACLYSAGDYIDNPTIVGIKPLSANSQWGWVDFGDTYALDARSDWGWGVTATMGDGFGTAEFPLLVWASEQVLGSAELDVGGVTLEANDLPIVVSSGIITQTPMSMLATGTGTSTGEAEFDAADVILLASDYSYGGADFIAVEPTVNGVSTGEATDAGSTADLLLAIDQYISDPVVYALIDETITLGDSIVVVLALDAGLVEYLLPSDDANATLLLTALLESNLQFTDNVNTVRAAMLQYATNLLTGAVGRYEGFDFAGFTQVGLQTYGWKRDGLYKLGYAEDTGEEIQALIDFAAEDFDSTNRKAVRALFFGADTDGMMYARMVDDNNVERTYRVIPHSDTHRANPAQKPTSRFWRLRLEIVDATFADLDNVEWKVTTTGRRTRS